jgi:hypothetical protein
MINIDRSYYFKTYKKNCAFGASFRSNDLVLYGLTVVIIMILVTKNRSEKLS